MKMSVGESRGWNCRVEGLEEVKKGDVWMLVGVREDDSVNWFV